MRVWIRKKSLRIEKSTILRQTICKWESYQNHIWSGKTKNTLISKFPPPHCFESLCFHSSVIFSGAWRNIVTSSIRHQLNLTLIEFHAQYSKLTEPKQLFKSMDKKIKTFFFTKFNFPRFEKKTSCNTQREEKNFDFWMECEKMINCFSFVGNRFKVFIFDVSCRWILSWNFNFNAIMIEVKRFTILLRFSWLFLTHLTTFTLSHEETATWYVTQLKIGTSKHFSPLTECSFFEKCPRINRNRRNCYVRQHASDKFCSSFSFNSRRELLRDKERAGKKIPTKKLNKQVINHF